MAFDGIYMAAVARELQACLVGGRVEKIYQPEREELHIIIRNEGKKHRLLISANAQMARVHITQHSKTNPTTPPLYCMVLRKHLEGAKLIGIEQPGLERVLNLTFLGYDELGESKEKLLVVEIMGKHSNIVLVDPESKTILDGIKRYTHAVSRHREIIPGREYVAPPSQEKLYLPECTEETFTQALLAEKLDSKLHKALLKILDGFSPLLCKEMLVRAGLDEDISLDQCGQYELNKVWQELVCIKQHLNSGTFQPTLVLNPQSGVEAFSSIPLKQFADWPTQTASAQEVVDTFFYRKQGQSRFRQISADLIKQVEEHIQRVEKKLAIQLENLLASENAEEYRIYGELLTANLHQIARGQEVVTLPNYYDPESADVTISLDPQYSPAENAQNYFKKYGKIKNSGKSARQYVEEYQMELDYLRSVVNNLEQAASVEDLEEIRQELAGEGYVKVKEERKNGKSPAKATQQTNTPLSFTSADGFTILVGKNNRQNDRLTLREAKDTDVWLHTKDIPGSHVIIRTDGQVVPDQTLEQAAQLAAWYSKAREAQKVPVDYTLRKHVHKPRGAKPGMVIYDNQQTLYIDPQPHVEK